MSDELRIEFPCDYPIHVIGEGVEGFRATVLDIVQAHADVARVTIVATGAGQLETLHRALLAEDAVRLVL